MLTRFQAHSCAWDLFGDQSAARRIGYHAWQGKVHSGAVGVIQEHLVRICSTCQDQLALSLNVTP